MLNGGYPPYYPLFFKFIFKYLFKYMQPVFQYLFKDILKRYIYYLKSLADLAKKLYTGVALG